MSNDEQGGVTYERHGHVARLTIDRPHSLNAMDSHAHLGFSEGLDRAQADEDIRVVVVTGSGERAFSVGRDLGEMAREATMTEEERAALSARWSRIRRLTDRHDFAKPVIARVNGYALGGGFEIVMACDIVVASETASFALPEPKRGLIAFAGGVHRLPRQIPLKVAMGHLLTGRSISAARAYELGLVNEVVPAEGLDAAVEAWVADILACAPLSVQATKQCAMQGLGASLPEAMAGRYPIELRRQASQDTREGPRAFAEKRKPVWSGT